MKRTCCFCSHANPARAKFCNECGTPLHLKPCAQCDAVNPRSAATCLKCGAALETVAYETPAAAMATERIMAAADDMLAALQRDLALTVRAQGDNGALPGAVGVVDRAAGASCQDAGDASAAPAREPEPALPEPEPVAQRVPPVVAPAEPAPIAQDSEPEPLPVMGERRDDSPAEDVDVWIDPETAPAREERAWRPRHGRRAAVVLLALVLFLTPAAFWTQRNPEQVNAWRERVAELFNGSGSPPTQPEASPADGASAPAVATSPAPSRAPAETPAPEAPTAPVVAEQQAPAADAGAAPAGRAGASIAEASPAAPAVTPPRESKSRARPAAKSRGTGRASTGARTERQAARGTKSAAAPARAAEPCTEAVAALGLCPPRGGSGRP